MDNSWHSENVVCHIASHLPVIYLRRCIIVQKTEEKWQHGETLFKWQCPEQREGMCALANQRGQARTSLLNTGASTEHTQSSV